MIFTLIALGSCVVAVAMLVLRKPPSKVSAPARVPAKQSAIVRDVLSTIEKKPDVHAVRLRESMAVAGPVPDVLRNFQLVRHAELPQEQVQTLLERLRVIPRPPHALHKLVSAQFLADATSTQLGELMMGEPQIAAKVLAVVNSPMYGLSKPLSSVGHAATFLGTTTVRGLCLQYMLNNAMAAPGPQTRALFDTSWNASALAGEMCFKLAQMLGFGDSGALITHVVLSHLGQLATYTLLPADQANACAKLGWLERATLQQAELGLSAAEIGSLLMREWGLPDHIVEDVRAIDLVALTAMDTATATRRHNAVLCFLCIRLGEMLASGELQDLQSFDLRQCDRPEFYYLRAYLDHPRLLRLPDYLHSPELTAGVSTMLSGMRLRSTMIQS